VDWCSI